ncbi:NAD(P)/FAD-dependent oxidoreductase [Consotaella aegiceratis]|uniref:NAD(P)/FAD-dependent oxidoreductase n=1 Tax=Consotaella aegiceratis TaxID=3097961 RepID=UPI002F3F466C
MSSSDFIVVGGGLVGAAVSYGLARQGHSVFLLDEGDVAFRASRGNFGLVWVQSKGDGRPEYARWTRHSADLWPDFSELLMQETGVAVHYHKAGGVHLCLSEAEFDKQSALIRRMHNVHGAAHYGATILRRSDLDEMLPGLGPDVVGGTYSPHDGHASPLYLLQALHRGLLSHGGRYQANAKTLKITPDAAGFSVETQGGTVSAGSVVLAAGLGNAKLGPMVGLDLPIKPLKGQILVTERTKPFLSMPTHVVRQTEEGSVLMGDSHEDSGFDISSGVPVLSEIARRAIRAFPHLAKLRVVRAWGALRPMTADGFPIYQQSEVHPGAFAVNCHSGVTLAGAHALALAPMIASGAIDPDLSVFSARRFDAQTH